MFFFFLFVKLPKFCFCILAFETYKMVLNSNLMKCMVMLYELNFFCLFQLQFYVKPCGPRHLLKSQQNRLAFQHWSLINALFKMECSFLCSSMCFCVWVGMEDVKINLAKLCALNYAKLDSMCSRKQLCIHNSSTILYKLCLLHISNSTFAKAVSLGTILKLMGRIQS